MTTQGSPASDVLTPAARKNAGTSIREEFHDGVEEVRERADTLYRRGKEKARELEHKLEDKIREKPIKSVLVAAGIGAGVGLLAGIMFSRR